MILTFSLQKASTCTKVRTLTACVRVAWKLPYRAYCNADMDIAWNMSLEIVIIVSEMDESAAEKWTGI